MPHGTTAPFRGRMFDFDEPQRLLGTAEMLAAGRHYEASSAGRFNDNAAAPPRTP